MLPHELSDIQHILPLLPPGEGERPLRRIRLLDPFLEIICAEVCVTSCLVKSELPHLCLYLALQGDIIIDPEGFGVGRHWYPVGGGGVLVLLSGTARRNSL